jgi:glycine dehydrogenase subunit 1
MTLIGKQGLRALAQLNLDKSEFMRKTLEKIDGVEVKRSSPTFNEFTVCLAKDAQQVVEAMIDKGFAAGFPLGRYYKGMDHYMIVAVTEKRTKQEILAYAKCLKEVLENSYAINI